MTKTRVLGLVIGLAVAGFGLSGIARADVIRFEVPVKLEKLFPEVDRVQVSCGLTEDDGTGNGTGKLGYIFTFYRKPVNGTIDETFRFAFDRSEAGILTYVQWFCHATLHVGPPTPTGDALEVGPGVPNALGRTKPGESFLMTARGRLEPTQ